MEEPHALKVSLEALAYALELKGVQVEQPAKDPETVEEIIRDDDYMAR